MRVVRCLRMYTYLFCKRKCFYCDFPVQAVGLDTKKQFVQNRMEKYINAAITEINCTKIMNMEPLDTVYFGGGTPSLIPPNQLERILQSIRQRFGVKEDAEITLEADPGTFTLNSLQQYMDLGVNRFSVGVQSFQQSMLEKCGRSHNIEQVYSAIQDVKQAKPASWSLDLISGLPDLNLELWSQSIDCAIKCEPDHISIYDLQIEESTPFARWYQQGKLNVPEDEIAIEMYKYASETLQQAGYEHYEVSNFCKPNKRSRHNMSYWNINPFYGFGLGAASYVQGRRFSRPKKMNEYYNFVEQLQQLSVQSEGGVLPGENIPEESQEDFMLDWIMLRCRLKDGIDMARFEAMFGKKKREKLQKSIKQFSQEGLVDIIDGAQIIRLNDPKGWLVSNDIISSIFVELSDQ
eukprot:TRINITY_DN4854_c0_g1_i5.p2 TRINITY_DN4854_c0_g1~~TRINITY_DN4854_c0_g1_i5.p2  ORF type:complete len:406 (-),score=28.76 TRINITY_DN4854_c0_g1_i5:223-1440(-)